MAELNFIKLSITNIINDVTSYLVSTFDRVMNGVLRIVH